VSIDKVLLCHRDWSALIKTRHIQNAETAMSLATPSVSQLKNLRSEEYAIGILVILLKEVCDNLNISGTMTDAQIGFAAQMIASDYFFLKISELRFCFLSGLMGKYGKVYDRLDVGVLYEWLQQYDKERASVLAERDRKRQSELNQKGGFLTEMPDEIRSKFLELGKSLESQNDESKNELAAKVSKYCSLKRLDVAKFLANVDADFKQANESDFEKFLNTKLT
jgi:hypothetical protein